MSSQGRFIDSLYDILDGHEDGDGKFHPGPLHHLPHGDLREVFDLILAAAEGTIGEFCRRHAKAERELSDLLAAHLAHIIDGGSPDRATAEAFQKWREARR